MHDIFFISYSELNAEENWERLINRFPWARRIHGVKGIHESHREAAKQCKTSHFFVVDGDTEILDFNFKYEPDEYDNWLTHIWYSRNAVNDLEYGYGGIKLFQKWAVNNPYYKSKQVDFSTSVSQYIDWHKEIASITHFNTDEFSTWRAAFRECTKLSSHIIQGDEDSISEERLSIWSSVGMNKPFGDYCIDGAQQGIMFGKKHKNNNKMLL